MTKRDVEIVHHIVKNDLQNNGGYMDSTTKSVYTEYQGEKYIAVYSTEDADTYPTVLYACKGNRSIFDKIYAEEYIKTMNEEIIDDRRTSVIDEISSSIGEYIRNNAKDIDAMLGRKGEPSDTSVYNRASRFKPNAALRICLDNLRLERGERDGGIKTSRETKSASLYREVQLKVRIADLSRKTSNSSIEADVKSTNKLAKRILKDYESSADSFETGERMRKLAILMLAII